MRLAAGLREAVLEAAFIGELSFREETDTPVSKIAPEIVDYRSSYSSVPKGWIVARFSDLYELVNGLASRGTKGGTERPVIRLADLSSGKIDDFSLRNILLSDKEYDSHQVNHGDIIIIRVNGSFSRVANAFYYDGERTFSYCDHLFCGHPKTKAVFPPFFTMMVNSPSFRKLIMPSIKTTAGQYTISQKSLGQTLIPLPPIEEQQRIVDRVNELMLAINEYEEIENRLVAMKEAFPGNLRDAILQAAVLGQLTEQDDGEDSVCFVDEIMATKKQMLAEKVINRDNSCKTQPIDESDIDLPEIPSNWTWARLGNLCSKIGAGSTPSGGSKVYVKSGIKFLREQNIHNSGLVTEGLVYITDEVNSSMKGSQVKAKDILVNITGASIGRNALVPDDFDAANVNQHVLIVRLIDDRLRHYIHQCLQSPFIFNQMMDKQMGDKPGLSATKVANFLIPIPPLAEQQRIVERLDAILPLCDELN